MPKYNAVYFINKFEAIPKELWVTGKFKKDDRYCAMGHCGVGANTDYADNKESTALKDLFEKHGLNVWSVNDSSMGSSADLGDSPKERIVNALVLIETGLLKELDYV